MKKVLTYPKQTDIIYLSVLSGHNKNEEGHE